MQTGLLEQVLLHDGGKILMVGNVLGEDHEGHRNIGREDRDKIAEAQGGEAAPGPPEGELR